MLTKRIIACLDVADGRTVKGVNFVSLREAGDPIALARHYEKMGADELAFLDIRATIESRKTLLSLVERIAKDLSIPFLVGGGIRSVEDARELLRAGADKISINSAAARRPELISEIADEFGSQAVVVAIDATRFESTWMVAIEGGRITTSYKVLEWAAEVEKCGAGELLITSIDHDGTKSGFAIDLIREITSMVKVPVIASGGAGTIKDFVNIFEEGDADAALAASIFHYNEIEIPILKKFLKESGIEVRI